MQCKWLKDERVYCTDVCSGKQAGLSMARALSNTSMSQTGFTLNDMTSAIHNTHASQWLVVKLIVGHWFSNIMSHADVENPNAECRQQRRQIKSQDWCSIQVAQVNEERRQ